MLLGVPPLEAKIAVFRPYTYETISQAVSNTAMVTIYHQW